MACFSPLSVFVDLPRPLTRWTGSCAGLLHPCTSLRPVVECGRRKGVNNVNPFSKENITFVIAVAGFLMSALSWLKEFWQKRNAIDLVIIDYANPKRSIVQFYLQFQNKSSMPASVSMIEVESKGNDYSCELEPKLIKETRSVRILTPQFPLSLPPMAFYSCYLEFLGVPNTQLGPGTVVSFRIHTSRGILRKSLTLSCKGHYLHIT